MDSINTKELFEIIDRLEKSRFDFLEIQTPDGLKIKLGSQTKLPPVHLPAAPAPQPAVSGQAQSAPVSPETSPDASLSVIKSPLIGVFYSASSPDAAPFVTIGKSVKRGDVVCIVEAMKVMNEIESDAEGEIVDILVQNGQTVEYGQPLFSVRRV